MQKREFKKRENNELRHVRLKRQYIKHAEGSALIKIGDTVVLCAASVEEKVPYFLKGSGTGWVTAEYSLLPRSTEVRIPREATKGRQTGRTQEIQRLIGRSLRSIMDLKALGERTITLDCDVLQADGGTRTAAITGAFVALVDAVYKIWQQKLNGKGIFPVRDFLAAVSVGVLRGEIILDLCYKEDSNADVDMNLVMNGSGNFVEIQGTGEKATFSEEDFFRMLKIGKIGIEKLISSQKDVLGNLAWMVGSE